MRKVSAKANLINAAIIHASCFARELHPDELEALANQAAALTDGCYEKAEGSPRFGAFSCGVKRSA
jgi:hypothetical protein